MEKIRTLISRLKLFCELELAMADKIDEIDRRVYALEQDSKLYRESIRKNSSNCNELRLILGNLKRGISYEEK